MSNPQAIEIFLHLKRAERELAGASHVAYESHATDQHAMLEHILDMTRRQVRAMLRTDALLDGAWLDGARGADEPPPESPPGANGPHA